MNLNAAFFFISKENCSKWIKSFSKYKPFKWNFESLVALRPTLPISCLGHYRGLTKCSKTSQRQLLQTAPSGLVIYFDPVKNWTRSLNDCATYPVWPSAVVADPHMLVVDEKL